MQQEALVPPTPPAVAVQCARPWQVTVAGRMLLSYALIGQMVVGLMAVLIVNAMLTREPSYIAVLLLPAGIIQVLALFCNHTGRNLLQLRHGARKYARKVLIIIWVLGGLFAFLASFAVLLFFTGFAIDPDDPGYEFLPYANLIYWGSFLAINAILAVFIGIPAWLLNRPAAKQAFGDNNVLG